MKTENVNVNEPGKSLVHHWSFCVGAGRANEALRAGWLEHLALARHHCGFRYVRFHGLFHDDMFVCREDNGSIRYNWQYIDEVFDRILELGVRPFVEFSFSPECMASGPGEIFWWKGRTSPPKDLQLWADLIEAFARHCIGRYGLEEVRNWYYEVWNEPNLPAFWKGGKARYFALYAATANALRAVDPGLRVGGPATANFVPDDRFAGDFEDNSRHLTNKVHDLDSLNWRGVWIEDFLQDCAANALPVDFVSTHPYPTDWALDIDGKAFAGRVRSVDSTVQDLAWLRDVVKQSAFPHAEIHLTEWSCNPSSRDHTHDYLPVASYIVRCNLLSAGLAQSLSYWTFTDVFEERGAGPEIFHGGFGLINYQGIVKPAFHAYRFLNQLGDIVLSQTDSQIVTRKGAPGGTVTALVWNYPEEIKTALSMSAEINKNAAIMQAQGLPREFALALSALPSGAVMEIETLDIENGAVRQAWDAMGCPNPPSRAQTELLKKAGWMTRSEVARANPDGTFEFNRSLPAWTIVMIREVR